MALIDGAIEFNMPPSQREVIRLRRDAIDDNDHKSVKLWIFERRNDNDAPWTPMYCFEDNVCFLPQDFEVMNYFTSTHRTSVYTYRVLCSKFILADKDDTSCTGEIILYENKVTRVLAGKTEVLAILKTEQERVDALYNYLGVRLSLAQVAGIRGMTSELRPGPQGLV